jgi:hypothetical protein
MALGELMSEDEADARASAEAADLAAAWAAFGVQPEAPQDKDVPAFHLLPECVPLFGLWQEVQTQWRIGFAGPTGMDYGAVEAYMRMSHNPLRRDPTTIGYLRGMERAAMKVFAEKRAEARA